MAFIECNFFSDALGMNTAAYIVLPQQNVNGKFGMREMHQPEKLNALYLLHGFTDDYTIWHRRTSIERYANDYGIAVIMPNGDKSYYTDGYNQKNYLTYVGEELPLLMRLFFPLSDEREHNFICGNSMGGYGALKAALTYPHNFGTAGSLSGTLDISAFLTSSRETGLDYSTIFGDLSKLAGSCHDLKQLIAENKKNAVALPRLFISCGTDDSRLTSNDSFKAFCDDLDIPCHYETSPGKHDWSYWDYAIQQFLGFAM